MDGDALIFIVILILSFPAAIFFIALATRQPLLPKRKPIDAAHHDSADSTVDFHERIKPLGRWRSFILHCTFGDTMPNRPGHFNPPEGADLFAAYREHFARLSKLWGEESDPLTISLYAAGRLLYGELSAADVIINNLPAQPFVLDHGAGYCLESPVRIMGEVLPLPQALKDRRTQTWLAGSAVQSELRAWLDAHRDKLRWDEEEGVYHETDPHEGLSN